MKSVSDTLRGLGFRIRARLNEIAEDPEQCAVLAFLADIPDWRTVQSKLKTGQTGCGNGCTILFGKWLDRPVLRFEGPNRHNYSTVPIEDLMSKRKLLSLQEEVVAYRKEREIRDAKCDLERLELVQKRWESVPKKVREAVLAEKAKAEKKEGV